MRRMFVATAIVMICVAVGVSAAVKKYGKDLTLKETTKISDIYAKTEAFNGKRVKVRGAIVDVCEMKGCWIALAVLHQDVGSLPAGQGIIEQPRTRPVLFGMNQLHLDTT